MEAACRQTRLRRRGSRARQPPPSVRAGCRSRSWREIGGGGETSVMDAKSLRGGISHVSQIGLPVGEIEDPLAQPFLETIERPGDPVVAQERFEVASPIALHRGRQGAPRLLD